MGVSGEFLYFLLLVSLSEELDSFDNRAVAARFHQLFSLPGDERLVNCSSFPLLVYTHLLLDYKCCYWNGKVPNHGEMYFSVNFVCFYSFIMGNETSIKLKWTDVVVTLFFSLSPGFQRLEKESSFIFPQNLVIYTRNEKYSFSMFLKFDDTFALASQLANIAMKQSALFSSLLWRHIPD